jgi:hypothetical protein
MGEKKIKKLIKSRKSNCKKKLIKLIKILKKPIGSVQFWFYKPETEKIELNPNRKNRKKTESNKKKPSQTEKTESNQKIEPNRFESVFILKTNRNRSV